MELTRVFLGMTALKLRLFYNLFKCHGATFSRYLFLIFVAVVNGTANAYAMLGEVFLDGQNRDVWCNSKKTVTDKTMYRDAANYFSNPYYATTPSSYSLTYMPPDEFLVLGLQSGSGILPSGPFYNEFFLCE
jgi:hypothetical protein